MRRLLLFLLFAGVSLGLAGCGSSDDGKAPSEAPQTNLEAQSARNYDVSPYPAPDTTLQTLDGGEINLAAQEGNVVLVNFWATWCAPCRKEIPDLVELQSRYQADGLQIVGIALDDAGTEVVRPFVEKRDINYPIVIDTTRSIEAHFDAMYGLPTTYVVNPKGQIVKRILGIFPVEKMKPTLEEMLNAAQNGNTT